ncbi:hypothetical protein SSABA_v1c03020 [Spiroplasma sabaudiense Ar-1343]|uniref:Uncharacterized protein n=1 Tax=Spiroplasma sabaudiense Ar-1343 TaxID=1276257 RepID=W6AJ36_9MOLU|nr:hypothetical protein [Spiroplasma sabaudiense]AHI53714.1 hypothetical protein SSABA_v1c03020 [Spiroplasma sabaudiense Ar-1343]
MGNKDFKTNDFSLLSTGTKIRIKSLIEKRLTMQTIALFAQEYESLDFETRKQINHYIKFLIELEVEEFIKEVEKLNKNFKSDELIRKQITFEEKQKNIKQLQSLLQNSEASISNRYMRKTKAFGEIPSKYEILAKRNFSEKNDKNILEGNLNVKTVLPLKSNEKYRKALKRERLQNQKQDEDRKKFFFAADVKDEKKVITIISSSKKNKITLTEAEREAISKKQKDKKSAKKSNLKSETSKKSKQVEPNVKKGLNDFSSVKSRIISDEEYIREQKEKERLWNQIYGKSKKDVENHSNKTTQESLEHNKIPNIRADFSGSEYFTVGNKKISVKELGDPQNPMYSFWQKVKAKSKANSLVFYFASAVPPKTQMKILLQYEKNLAKYNSRKLAASKKKK